MEGKIVKGIASFYYVHVPDVGLYECKAKGIFRNQNIKPLVGDNVLISVKEGSFKEGLITDILARKNKLIRPAVVNIDQALIVFSVDNPKPSFNLLDRFLISVEMQRVEAILCFNKKDLVAEEEIEQIKNIYKNTGYKIIFVSAEDHRGLDELGILLQGKTTALAGPSGVGKSSIINILQPEANMEVGDISKKIARGKHTTRHSEIFNISNKTYIMDTPGFSSLLVNEIMEYDLKDYFVEFKNYQDHCKFPSCIHVNEPKCAVKDAVEAEEINPTRYKNYLSIYEELKNLKRY